MTEIFALRLKPISLRIGSITAGGAPEVPDGPGVARVSRGKIIFGKYSENIMEEW